MGSERYVDYIRLRVVGFRKGEFPLPENSNKRGRHASASGAASTARHSSTSLKRPLARMPSRSTSRTGTRRGGPREHFSRSPSVSRAASPMTRFEDRRSNGQRTHWPHLFAS